MKKTMKKSTKGFLNNLITYAIVIIAFVFTQMALSKMIPGVTISRSLKGQLIPICVYIVMAVSLNLTVGISGELSLGHAGFMSVGAFSGIIMSGWLLNAFQMENETMRLVLAMLTGGVCAAIAGVLIGIPVLRLRGDYLAIVTLAFGEIIRNVMNCLYFAVSDGKLIINFNNPRIDGTLPFRGDSSHLYKYCTGGKTGYTTVANNTLVSFAEKDGITLVCVVMDAATPDHYTDTRKLFDYCFENFQALNISENDAGLAKDNGKNYGVLNNSEPYVKLDEDAYIIMPKGAQFSDASYKKTESAKGKKKVARLAYTYAGHEVGSVDIVKTGAKVKDNYYVNTDSGQKKNERVIRIDPAWLIVAGVVIVAAVVLLFLAKRAYDNFYVIRHQRKTKKNDKMRFREKKRKKYNRRKDRFF